MPLEKAISRQKYRTRQKREEGARDRDLNNRDLNNSSSIKARRKVGVRDTDLGVFSTLVVAGAIGPCSVEQTVHLLCAGTSVRLISSNPPATCKVRISSFSFAG